MGKTTVGDVNVSSTVCKIFFFWNKTHLEFPELKEFNVGEQDGGRTVSTLLKIQ